MGSMLFNLPPSEPLPRSSTLDRDRDGRPTWTSYRPKTRVACDECVIILHEAHGVGPYPRSARWTRTSRARDGSTLRARLCREHAEMWKKDDGLYRDTRGEYEKRKRG